MDTCKSREDDSPNADGSGEDDCPYILAAHVKFLLSNVDKVASLLLVEITAIDHYTRIASQRCTHTGFTLLPCLEHILIHNFESAVFVVIIVGALVALICIDRSQNLTKGTLTRSWGYSVYARVRMCKFNKSSWICIILYLFSPTRLLKTMNGF